MSKDERKFEDVVRSIAASEEDVDKILTAARLERHEGPPRYLNAEQKMSVIYCAFGLAGLISLFAFFLTPVILRYMF